MGPGLAQVTDPHASLPSSRLGVPRAPTAPWEAPALLLRWPPECLERPGHSSAALEEGRGCSCTACAPGFHACPAHCGRSGNDQVKECSVQWAPGSASPGVQRWPSGLQAVVWNFCSGSLRATVRVAQDTAPSSGDQELLCCLLATQPVKPWHGERALAPPRGLPWSGKAKRLHPQGRTLSIPRERLLRREFMCLSIQQVFTEHLLNSRPSLGPRDTAVTKMEPQEVPVLIKFVFQPRGDRLKTNIN